MSGYIWYSAGSDVTGPKLAEALGFNHGKKTPKIEDFNVLVGWGCKAESRQLYDPQKFKSCVEKGDLRILNNPEAITKARNKVNLFTDLKHSGIQIPGFFSIKGISPSNIVESIEKAIQDGLLQLPCAGFNEYNRDEPVFCWTKEDLNRIVTINKSRKKESVKIHYFRSLFQGTEYRIHVFRDEVIHAEQKILSKDPIKSTASSLYRRLSKKKDMQASEKDVQLIVAEIASDLMKGPSHLQRSVKHGWQLSPVVMNDIPAEVLSTAINALEVAGLDMGAVSIILEENTPIVTNVISAPGLNDQQMALYVDAIKEFTESNTVKPRNIATKKSTIGTERASTEIVAKITRRVRMGKISQKKAEEVLKVLTE